MTQALNRILQTPYNTGPVWETQIKITLKLPHLLEYTEAKLNLVRWLKVFGLVKISRLKKEYQLKFESLWYCHETTAFDLGTDIETITNKATECTEIPRWPRNGQKVKMEGQLSEDTHRAKLSRKLCTAVQKAPDCSPTCLTQLILRQSELPQKQPSAGADSCLCSNSDFHSVPPLWWLWRVSVPPHRGMSSSGCLWSCTVRRGAKCGRCSQTLLQERCQIK